MFKQHGQSTQQGNFLDLLSSKNNKLVDGIICAACLSIVDSLIPYSKTHKPQEFHELLRSVCVDLKIQSEKVCAALIDIHLVNEFHSYSKNVLLHRWIRWPCQYDTSAFWSNKHFTSCHECSKTPTARLLWSKSIQSVIKYNHHYTDMIDLFNMQGWQQGKRTESIFSVGLLLLGIKKW